MLRSFPSWHAYRTSDRFEAMEGNDAVHDRVHTVGSSAVKLILDRVRRRCAVKRSTRCS